jgi:pimeloyl-ACP methyl ester carboxylesterase
VVTGVGAFEAPMQWEPWWPDDSAGSSATRRAELGGDGREAAEAFLRRVLGDERFQALGAKEQRLAEGTALVAELLSVRHGPVPYDLATLPVPVLAGTGTDSLAHMQRAAAVLADEVPRGELYVLEGADHGAHVRQPAAFAAFARRAVALAAGS